MSDLLCPLCRGDAEPDVARELLGRHGNVRIRVLQLPIRRCTYCEKSSVRYNDFLADLVPLLVQMNTVSIARRVGLFTKQPGCVKCKTLLGGAEAGPVNFKKRLELTNPPFDVDLSVLAEICPKCSTPNIIPGEHPLERDMRQAFLNGCTAVAIHCPTTEIT